MTLAKVRADDIRAETSDGRNILLNRGSRKDRGRLSRFPVCMGAGVPTSTLQASPGDVDHLEISGGWGWGTWNPRVCGTGSEEQGGFQELGCVTLGPCPSLGTVLSLV